MAKKLRVGDVIRGYRVTHVFGPGMMAISYGAQAPAGAKIFLKQYKSPAPTVVWYEPFVDYQQELASRIRNGKAAHYAVRLVDSFEEKWGGPCYFQAYEFIEHGSDLQEMLDEERAVHAKTRVAPASDPAVWARHVTWAKVLMAGIAAIHESKIVHADLKPPNAYLIKDASIGSGYQLKLIDMDFSVLADKRAPWHGHQGYVGSDNYRSPEHMTRGAVPIMASDIFTCGLMLHELLAGTHPYWSEDQTDYARQARAHAIKAPALVGQMPAPATNSEVSAIMHRCLSPDPAKRPTAAAIRAALSGRTAKAQPKGAIAGTGTKAGKAASPTSKGSQLVTDRLRLVPATGDAFQVGVRTVLGKALLRRFGSDAEFWDDTQCTIERSTDGRWLVTPASGTVNETLLNGATFSSPQVLREGDVLAVGRSAKGISKLPLTVRSG